MRNSVRKTCIFLVAVYLKLFYHHKVYGKEHISKAGGILASNHSSFLDPPILGVSCPDEVHFLARASLFRGPIFGWLIRTLNTHPVTPGKGNISTFKKAYELLSQGKKVVVFPEGTRSPDGQLQEGKAGVGMLVLRAKCRVIPVYIHGSYEVWNVHNKLPHLFGRRTACVFGSAVDFSHFFDLEDKKEAQEKIVKGIMEAIARLRDWFIEGAYGSPP